MGRTKFDRELEKLQENMIGMASLLDKSREYFIRAFREKNTVMAEKTAHIDDELRRYKDAVEEQCLMLLINQQPVAGDMRHISSALKMITHLKRMSAQITAAVRIMDTLLDDDIMGKIPHLMDLAESVGFVVNACMTALIHEDPVAAAQMDHYDDRIDQLFHTVLTEIAGYLRTEHGHEEAALNLLLAVKYMEKTGDHAVSTARWLIFSITGTR